MGRLPPLQKAAASSFSTTSVVASIHQMQCQQAPVSPYHLLQPDPTSAVFYHTGMNGVRHIGLLHHLCRLNLAHIWKVCCSYRLCISGLWLYITCPIKHMKIHQPLV